MWPCGYDSEERNDFATFPYFAKLPNNVQITKCRLNQARWQGKVMVPEVHDPETSSINRFYINRTWLQVKEDKKNTKRNESRALEKQKPPPTPPHIHYANRSIAIVLITVLGEV